MALWHLLLPAWSCQASPQLPSVFLCRTKWSGRAVLGCSLEAFRPDPADIRFDWQAQCFWLPIFNNRRSSQKNLISYLSLKTGNSSLAGLDSHWAAAGCSKQGRPPPDTAWHSPLPPPLRHRNPRPPAPPYQPLLPSPERDVSGLPSVPVFHVNVSKPRAWGSESACHIF